MTITDLGWNVVWFLSLVLHASWIVIALWSVGKFLKVKRLRYQAPIVFVGWVTMVAISSGCPITYLHETIELKARWIDKRDYKFEDSLAYKYAIKPVRDAIL